MEIILYDVVLCVLSTNVLKSFYSFHEIETIRPCVYVHTTQWFHDISGCEIVVYGVAMVEHSTCCYFKIVDLHSH